MILLISIQSPSLPEVFQHRCRLTDPHEQDIREVFVAVQTEGPQSGQAPLHHAQIRRVGQEVAGHECLAAVDEGEGLEPPGLPEDAHQVLLAHLAAAELKDPQGRPQHAPQRKTRHQGQAEEAEVLKLLAAPAVAGQNVREVLQLG